MEYRESGVKKINKSEFIRANYFTFIYFTDSEFSIKVRLSLKAAMGENAVSIINYCYYYCYYGISCQTLMY